MSVSSVSSAIYWTISQNYWWMILVFVGDYRGPKDNRSRAELSPSVLCPVLYYMNHFTKLLVDDPDFCR